MWENATHPERKHHLPIYLDRHSDLNVSADELFNAHLADLEAQEQFGVKYLSYWFDYNEHKAYCLVDAPSPEAAAAVHAEAHGVMADKLISVDPTELYKYMGGGSVDDEPSFNPNGQNEQTLRTVVFTDIVGSSDAAHRLGDDVAMAMLRDHNRIVRDNLDTHKGREVKHTGDGIMASFSSVSNAIRCAMAVQEALQARNEAPDSHEVHVRIGLAAGEPIAEEDDLFGTTVNLAARVCDVADAGAVFVTNVVKELSIGKNFEFEHVADVELKGFPDPVPVSKVVS